MATQPMPPMHSMSTLHTRVARRLAKWVAWSLVALNVALSLGFLLLLVAVTGAASAPGTPFSPEAAAQLQASSVGWLNTLIGLVACWAFAVLGALIVSRDPAHAIGWLFCAIGFLQVVEPFTGYYALYVLFVAPGALPLGLLVGWLQNWLWVVSAAVLIALVPLRFPTGRLVSARWKPAWWLATGATVAGVLGAAFHPGPLWNYLDRFDVPNPFGLPRLGGLALMLSDAPFGLLLASMLVAAASLVMRLRRARGVERAQIKWFAYFGVLLALLFVLQFVVQYVLGISSPSFAVAWALSWSVAFIGLPVATGLSILRYRLFDIDVLIRLTLVYGTLSALLVGAYVALVLAGQAAVRGLTGERGEQPVVIVASTLLVVALSTPLRRGVRAAVDRRFYRRQYDAERTLVAFGQALRQEVDPERLRQLVLAVAEETMRPAHASLWLRTPTRRVDREQQPVMQRAFRAAAPGEH
jgi:hypothetical protein